MDNARNMYCSSFAFSFGLRRPVLRQWLCLAILLLPFLAGAAEDPAPAVRQLWQMLDYVAVDYAGAVQDGAVIDVGEFGEMQEFAATVRERMATLPAREQQPDLISRADALQAAVQRHAAPGEVAELARTLADRLLTAYPIPVSPQALPDLARGATLYQEQCASCHGPTGHGDGPAAETLEPRPVDFTDPARARERSLHSLYETISQGVSGTSMAAFETLSANDRWALAFYVGGFAYPQSVRDAGARLWTTDATSHRHIVDLASLSRTSEGALAQSIGDETARELLGYLRANPGVLQTQDDGLDLARDRLAQSVEAYARGDRQAATRLALSAYLDGIEPIEPQLSTRDAALLRRIENAMAEYRTRISKGAPAADVQTQADNVAELIGDAAAVLRHTRADAATAFIASFTILLREGLEALLIVIAIVAFLRKTERRDVMKHVHAGWVGALLAGGVTWLAATYLINISGAQRELTEGYSSLFAAFVLLGVGLWMHQKSFAGRWQHYIDTHLKQALNGRSAWLLLGLVFITVYREVFETILFYAALTSEGNGAAILAGLVAGALALAAIGIALLHFSVRLPIGKFFSVSSIFIAVLSVILAGKGVAALQEAGVLGVHTVPFPSVPLLGISPSVQALTLQFVVAIIAIAGFAWNARSSAPSR